MIFFRLSAYMLNCTYKIGSKESHDTGVMNLEVERSNTYMPAFCGYPATGRGVLLTKMSRVLERGLDKYVNRRLVEDILGIYYKLRTSGVGTYLSGTARAVPLLKVGRLVMHFAVPLFDHRNY